MRTRHTPEQVTTKLRQTEVDLAAGAPVAQVCQKLGVSEVTFPPLAGPIRRPESRRGQAA